MTVVPDYKAALVEWLRSRPAMLEWCPREHIVHRLDGVIGGPANWIAVVAAGGTADVYLPWMHARLDVHIYGATGFEAMRGWRILKSELEPADRRAIGFSMLACTVSDVRVGLPVEMIEPPNWEKRLASIVLSVREVAA